MLTFHQFVAEVNRSNYKLDLSGVVGMLGGNNAVDALETIHLYAGRRWTGWYNYPGALTVAKKFGQMADSRLWDSLFPGPNESPAVAFNLAGKSGPGYSGVISGTDLKQTKHLGHLIAQECAKYRAEQLKITKKSGDPGRKTGSSATVTVISLPPNQHNRILESEKAEPKLNADDIKKRHEHIHINPKPAFPVTICAIVPSLISIVACALCVVARDFLCASLILVGIFCSGVSSLTLGAATLNIRVPVPSSSSPRGDGYLLPADGSIIILKGEEADVNIVTKGEFELEFSHLRLQHEKHHMVGVCSLLLMAQFLVQLLLIPLCTFFGQILYLLSFVASGVYHLYVVSHERDEVQRELLLHVLSPDRRNKWKLGTRTQMAVFVCLMLGDNGQYSKTRPEEILKRIISNDTPVWEYWRQKVLKELALFWKSGPSTSYEPSIRAEPDEPKAKIGETTESEKYADFTDSDKLLLRDLVDDAWGVFNEYPGWRRNEFQRQQVLREKSFLRSVLSSLA